MSISSILAKIKSIFSPLEQEALTFAHTLEADFEQVETADLQAAFAAGTEAYTATPGTPEVKALAALAAIGTELLGDAVSVVKTAAAQTAVVKAAS